MQTVHTKLKVTQMAQMTLLFLPATTALQGHRTLHSYLSHFPAIEKVFHDKQIQLLFSVVLRVLVTNSIYPKDFSQRCGLLMKTRHGLRSLCRDNQQSHTRSTTVLSDSALQLRSPSIISTLHLKNTLLV